MKILKWAGILILAIILIGLIASLLLPKEVHIERKIMVNAPRDQVFDYVIHFGKFIEWSPWQEIDPDVKYEINDDGAEGARYHWMGNDEVGEGEMVITHVSGMDSIAVALEFIKPFKSSAKTYYLLKDVDNGTEVTWGFKARYGVPMNLLLALSGMNKALKADFDKGLNKLKEVVESAEQEGYEVKEIELNEQNFLVKKATLKFNEIQDFYSQVFGKLASTLPPAAFAGPPSGLFWNWDEPNGMTEMAAGFPIDPSAIKSLPEAYEIIKIEPGKALMVEFYGAYDAVGPAHEAIEKYMNANHLEMRGPAIESYMNDPGSEPDTSKWQTNIIYPVK